MTALVELLCDERTVRTLPLRTTSSRLALPAGPGHEVFAAVGHVAGRPIACYAQDGGYLGGSLDAANADTIVRVLGIARGARMPVVGFVQSAGARIQEGTAALAGYARVFRYQVALSGVVPQITVVHGPSAGGGCYSPALSDFVVMTRKATMFLTGPRVVAEALGERVSASDLGGPQVHARNGVCDLLAADDAGAVQLARDVLGYLPSHSGEPPPYARGAEPELSDPGALLPAEPRRVYDVRAVVKAVVDCNSLLEVSAGWARNIVTALARLEGRPVGVVANQPKHLGGAIDAAACEKAVRFISMCEAFRLPLVVLVDTPGFLPGMRQEHAGVIRHGASLVRGFAAATVPRVTVVLRKAFGGAYITMNCKDLGADLSLAWAGAEIGVMGAQAAVGVVNRRELASARNPGVSRDRLASAYARQHLAADVAAAGGFIDEVIQPRETRARVSQVITACCGEPTLPASAFIPPRRRRSQGADRTA